MDEITITVPTLITEPIKVVWGGVEVTESMGVTELLDLLAMALRARLDEKRLHPGEGDNFYGATDPSATSR